MQAAPKDQKAGAIRPTLPRGPGLRERSLNSQQAIRAVKASTLTDMPVRNQQGETRGEIEDVMIDPSEGRIAFVILDFGGWFDLGGNLVAAPWEALSLSPGAEALTLNLDKTKLRNAPTVARPYRPAWPWPRAG
jgi:sporulation protein YlmC with PRC-barrel domain